MTIYTILELQQYVLTYIVKSTGLSESSVQRLLVINDSIDHGTFSLNCHSIQDKACILNIQPDNQIIENVEYLNNYCNIYVYAFVYTSIVCHDIVNSIFYGSSIDGEGKTIVIEYSGPNTNKPLHLGHLRNQSIGMSLVKLYRSQGYNIISMNVLNDRGVHICKSMLMYQLYGDSKTPYTEKIKGDHFVGSFYTMFDSLSKEHPELQEDAQKMLILWENGDLNIRSLWEKMRDWVFSGFGKTYMLFGSLFDTFYYESDLFILGKHEVEVAKNQGFVYEKEDHSLWIDLTEYNLDHKLVLRSDGTSVYTTQDIAGALEKYNDFHYDQSLYVVASEQDLHFKTLFAILNKFGYVFADRCKHVSYGMVTLPNGIMKTREGNVVDADDILQYMITLAQQEILSRRSDLDKSVIEKISKIIGIGALKYYMLRYGLSSTIKFDPKKSIDLVGKTSVYIQYAYVRCHSILLSVGYTTKTNITYQCLDHQCEQELIALLAIFPIIVKRSVQYNDPSKVAEYSYHIALLFNSYYNQCRILQDDDTNLTEARLLLCYCVSVVLKNSLELLDIEVPEVM